MAVLELRDAKAARPWRMQLATAALLALASSMALGQQRDAMTEAQYRTLLGKGATIMLGGEGHGYSGSLTLDQHGTGKGEARLDDGTELTINGSWLIKGGQFCRAWREFDDGNEVCEDWVPTSERSVDVYVGGRKIGVNAW